MRLQTCNYRLIAYRVQAILTWYVRYVVSSMYCNGWLHDSHYALLLLLFHGIYVCISTLDFMTWSQTVLRKFSKPCWGILTRYWESVCSVLQGTPGEPGNQGEDGEPGSRGVPGKPVSYIILGSAILSVFYLQGERVHKKASNILCSPEYKITQM